MLESLNQLEYEIAQLAALGATQKEIAYALSFTNSKVNNTMRVVHQKLGTDEHSLPRVFIGEKYDIKDIAEPLTRYSFFAPSPKLRLNAIVAITLVLLLEFFNGGVIRVRKAARARRTETEYVFSFNIES